VAIFRFEVKIIGRADRRAGRSVVAAAAYRSGSKLRDERYGKTHDYSRRAAGIADTWIDAPEAGPEWLRYDDRQGANYTQSDARAALWNSVEIIEDSHNRRDTARLARELVLALPHELTRKQRRALVKGFVSVELVSLGMVTDVAIHEPQEGKNFHAHILTTLRRLDGEGFGEKKERAWDKKELLLHLRKAWADAVNDAMAAAGLPGRVDHRSLAEQGVDRLPQPKIGPAAAAMERRGIETERGRRAEIAAMTNAMLPHIRDVQRYGEVRQYGVGASWWERAQVSIGTQAGGDPPQGGPPGDGGNGIADPPALAPPAAAPGAAAPGWREYVAGRRADDKEPERER
jgi:hypothetical protein